MSLFLQNVVPVCYVFRLQKEWGSGGTAQREGLYQKLSTTTVIKEAARAHTTRAAAKVKWKHFLFSAVAPKDNKRWFYYAKWGAAGTQFLDGPPPIFPKLYPVGKQQVTVPVCFQSPCLHTPSGCSHLGRLATRQVGPQPPWWQWRRHQLSSAPSQWAVLALLGSDCWSSNTEFFSPCPQLWVSPQLHSFATTSGSCHIPKSRTPRSPWAPCVSGAHWGLGKVLVHGTPTPCQQGWPVPSVWAGRAEGAGTDLLSHGTWGFSWWLQKPVCRFSEGKEVIQKLHAYFWIHSLRGVCLSSFPLGSVCIAGILSQSYRIIPSSPQATACQWSPQSLARQPGHMKSYTQRFNAFSWPQPLFVWIPCSVFLTRCQGSFALSRVLRRWLFSCRISTLLELSPEL